MEKFCIACGMPMTKAEDFAAKDVKKDYCCYCAKEDGSMKSYEETLEHSIIWAQEDENFKMMGFEKKPTETELRKAIIAHMATLPAWKK